MISDVDDSVPRFDVWPVAKSNGPPK